ncbi:ABC transporter ATP-binding protein [Neobacillus sp. MM2021_6]|uniref:ABC transporter ATP-binding protein n=1 Tax=Bacillaceae TaxID=186817 RepID=UPI00140BE918|nr:MULTISPECIES: ABC transporter ATP-binding protein [Bacillaceae]MBO0962189.1 ABC transporter ATP-binding protein [Neobacillus sp. MM2021_6]NHC19031.1 ABC transporter ATP-binding protein [Bacillus sp. MM2020_4]
MKEVFYFVKKLHSYSGKVLYVNLLGMIVMSLLEGIGILFLIPMISMSNIVNIETKGIPFLGIFDFLQDIPSNFGLPIILGIYIFLVIGQNILQRQITIKNTMIQHGFFRQLRIETYDALLHANWDFFIKRRRSDLLNFMTTEIATASAGTNSFFQFIASLIFTLIQIGIAFVLSPNITIFVLISGLVLIFFSRKYLKRSFALGGRNYESGKNYLAGITDQINGIKDIKSNTLEESRMTWFRNVTLNMQNEQVEYSRLSTKSQLFYKVASAILIGIFLLIAMNMFHAQGGQLILIVLIFSRLWPRVAGIQASLEQIAMRIPSYKAVITLQNECRQAREFRDEDALDIKPLQIRKAIECQEVFFRYNKNLHSYALQDINLCIPANEMTAVVGRSGAGKSTLIDLLMGLNKPEAGEVLLDGTPLSSTNLLSLRRVISYVPQEPYLFNESIRENLLIVEPNASEEQIWEALEFSSSSEFVKKLPYGLDTMIGDRGIRLSGGERQRLVLARAILRNPSILVLDEATSSLDTENEAKIQEALERLKGRMTIIVIAHRLSTIRNADQVIVLEQGEIIQNGEFLQLAKEKKSMFNKLLRNQMEATL